MKRYGIYITVILILLSGSYFSGFSQQNSSIVTIQKTYPNEDIIFDPAMDSIIFFIELTDYFIWEDEPPDSIGYFSLSNDYAWAERPVTNTTRFQPEYKAVSPVYYFDQEHNTVCFWLHDEDNDIDTTVCIVIDYNKPRVELLSADPADKVPGLDHYVIYDSNPTLEIKANSSFPSTNVLSYITRVEIKEDLTSFWYPLWEDASGVPEIEFSIDLPETFSILPGTSRSFALRATGRTDDDYNGPAETSVEFPFTLTYMYTNFPDTICRVNTNISLEALPLGGIFEGKGIVDNTSYFNPSLADANASNLVTYKFIIEETEFTLSEPIFVVDLPAVELIGDLEVWANSTDVKYTILNPETSKYIYNWTFTGVDEILESTDISRTVRWESDPESYIGKIVISLESQNETQFCPAVFEYLVDIDPDKAPDKPCVCFGDISRHLLFSSNTQALYYKWYTSEGDSIGFTETPYYYLNADIIKDNFLDNSTTYFVRIANQLTGGYTRGDMCEEETCPLGQQNSLLVNKNEEELSVTVLNNPVHGQVNLETSGNYTGQVVVKIVNLNGVTIATSQFDKGFLAENHIMNPGTELRPGIYLVICQYGNSRTAPVKLIVY